MARVGRTPLLKNPASVNLSGEAHEISDAKVYAGATGVSLSSMFFTWLRPRIKAHKETNPEHYGDCIVATGQRASLGASFPDDADRNNAPATFRPTDVNVIP